MHHARLASLFALVVCASPVRAQESAPRTPPARATDAAALPGVLVPLAWMVEHERTPRLVLLDVREPAAYAAGHLPGARNVPHRRVYAQEPGRESDLASVRAINELFGGLGIDRSESVVVYGDETDFRAAAVVFWALEVHGHPSVGVLNGGALAWQRAGRPLSTEAVAVQAKRFIAQFRPERLVDKLEVRRAIADRRCVILDARSADEYSGSVTKEGAKRAGHIPSAVHRAVQPLYRPTADGDGTCTIADTAALTRLYADLAGKKVYAYCHTGRSAALTYLALRAVGADAAVYDGSWSEWSQDEKLPIETGSVPGS
jgi:thiosulfate/3-mercaptopyruvate sulfurtransferase